MKPTEPAVCSMAPRSRATLGTVGDPGSALVTVTMGSDGASVAGAGCACVATPHDAASSAHHAVRTGLEKGWVDMGTPRPARVR
ncbi:hypothetical protein GCM10022279_23810 [Comamonas faecalis]|uniref:Uncharacterized protein n=1 Tax=Comamonas faecalis TaxID=1387849 RepID=A0ABP7RLV8_9BURK